MLVSGMIIGTVFTLFVVPSIYMLLATTHHAIAVEREEDDRGSLGVRGYPKPLGKPSARTTTRRHDDAKLLRRSRRLRLAVSDQRSGIVPSSRPTRRTSGQ